MAGIGSDNSREFSFLMLRRFRFGLSARDEVIPLALGRLFDIVGIFSKTDFLISEPRSGTKSELNQNQALSSVRRGSHPIASIQSAFRSERAGHQAVAGDGGLALTCHKFVSTTGCPRGRQ